MSLTRTRRLRSGAATLVAVGLLVTACGGTTRDEAQNQAPKATATGKADAGATIKEGLKIAFLPKQVNNPYFTVSDGGGKVAVEEIKGAFKEVGPSEASASSQVSYINTLIQQRGP